MAKIERVSSNFKLPKTLVEALKAKAQEEKTTATDLVIQGIHHVLGLSTTSVDNSTDNVLHEILTRIETLETKPAISTNGTDNRLHSIPDSAQSQQLSNLEQKLEVVTRRLELLEIAIASGRYANNSKPRRQAYPYQQSYVELQALATENLASRLGLTASYLASEKQRLSEKDFVNWSRNRDPRSIGWRFDPEDGLYHPVPQ
ncbi:hypothetical protein A6770_40555 [Nostoc minutum NIES-26]|uniref:Uncharacterized protein n=1 Tax=Nostoc minutum NIES-26 TaxID=1844469 RepID=A0A367RJF0_9NOSO|nr:hypothetical protein A6770_40555 [Nostoc minutum NIES-26]